MKKLILVLITLSMVVLLMSSSFAAVRAEQNFENGFPSTWATSGFVVEDMDGSKGVAINELGWYDMTPDFGVQANYQMEFKLKIKEWGEGGAISIFLTHTSTPYSYRLGVDAEKIFFIRYDDANAHTFLDTKEMMLEVGKTYNVKVVVSSEVFEAYLDGAKVLSQPREDELEGQILFASWMTKYAMDDLKVSDIESDAPVVEETTVTDTAADTTDNPKTHDGGIVGLLGLTLILATGAVVVKTRKCK
jgi:hypothetical protein